MLGEIPRWRCAQRGWLFLLRAFQSYLSAPTDSFLFREQLRPSRPRVFFLTGTCEEKTVGQRIWAASDKRAHIGSMPACLTITTERALACPLHPTWSASLCGCEWHDLVRCEWQWIGWQPFSGSWPHPLAVICFTQCQTQSGWKAHPHYDEGCQQARALRLDKRLQRYTLWLCSRSSRTRCSPMRKPVWIQPHSGTRGAWPIWLYPPPKPLPRPLGIQCPAW